MEITIERTSDHRELARLNETVQTWHHQNYPDEFKPYDPAGVASAFEKLLMIPDVFAFVARSNGEAIGYVLGYIKRRPNSAFQYEKAILNIDQIAVVQSHRRSGVGKLLLEAAVALAKENGITEIQLDHWTGNDLAEKFFSSHGFVHFNHRMMRSAPAES